VLVLVVFLHLLVLVSAFADTACDLSAFAASSSVKLSASSADTAGTADPPLVECYASLRPKIP